MLKRLLIIASMAGLVPATQSIAQLTNSRIVATCGSLNPGTTYVAGQTAPDTQDTNGNRCYNGTGGTTPPPLSLQESDQSSGITTGGTFQSFGFGTAATLNSFEFENICSVAAAGGCVATTDNCYICFRASGCTKSNSILVVPGAYYGRLGPVTPNSPGGANITVTCDGTGDKFWAQKQ